MGNIIISLLLLASLIIVELIKKSNNDDLIKENCKNQEQYENIINAQKVYHRTKLSKILIAITALILIIFILWDFTSIEVAIIEFISPEFYTETPFDRTLYFIPIYVLVAREIIIQVKIGEFLLKYFNVEEPVLEENIIKSILYKKKTPVEKKPIINNTIEETKKDS